MTHVQRQWWRLNIFTYNNVQSCLTYFVQSKIFVPRTKSDPVLENTWNNAREWIWAIQNRRIRNSTPQEVWYTTAKQTGPCYSTGRIPHTWPILLREAANKYAMNSNKRTLCNLFLLARSCQYAAHSRQEKQYNLLSCLFAQDHRWFDTSPLPAGIRSL